MMGSSSLMLLQYNSAHDSFSKLDCEGAECGILALCRTREARTRSGAAQDDHHCGCGRDLLGQS